MRGVRWNTRTIVAAVLAIALVAVFCGYAFGRGLGAPSVPSDAVAVVQDAPDGTISVAEFNRSLGQTAARQGISQPPKPSDPQYAALRDAAMSDVLLSRWVRGEADERGISVSQAEVSNQLQQLIKQQFGGQAQFQKFLKQSGFTPQEARSRIELQLLSTEIQKQVLPTNPSVSETDVKNFYEANKSQFTQPETRDVRVIVNSDQAKVAQAKALLAKDDSPQSWKKVAAKYSTDKTTKDSGGLRQGVAQGQSEPALEQQIFSASANQLVGPFKGQAGYYLVEVVKVTPATTTPLDKVASQIRQQLSQGEQQQAAQDFQTDFADKWTSRTFCATAYLLDRCANFVAKPQATPGGAPVVATRPIAPGQAALFPGQPAQGLPQGPVSATPARQTGVIGPGGAPQLPPGAVPPGASPQGASPPQAVPPGG